MRVFIIFFSICLSSLARAGDDNFLPALNNHNKISLNGNWKIIIDPYESGYYSYRYQPRSDGYFLNKRQTDKTELIEYNFDMSEELKVPGDWNTQMEKLFLYEGTIWYKKSFVHSKKQGQRSFICFGAVNYHAIVYINGIKSGEHTGGFTPFNFEITNLIKDGDNFVVVKADNKRLREGVPTLNTDWWNYGGITRDVYIVNVPDTFIKDYSIQLLKGSLSEARCRIKLDGTDAGQNIFVRIAELGINETIISDKSGNAELNFKFNGILWSPSNPKLYNIEIISGTDTVRDKIGFRSIQTAGDKILLNGNEIFLRGISVHEEAPMGGGRANSELHADTILTRAKELGCNFVRLAHYPHNEHTIKRADELGILVWAEIPVYWTILWDNPSVLQNAENQLLEMIMRDKNRASVIIWSVANETPVGAERLKFLRHLIESARTADDTRLITAATEIKSEKNKITLTDPLSEYLDVIGVNEYIGWYWGAAEDAPQIRWESPFNKPLIISEFGADAKAGLHGDKDTRFTEEYQANVYNRQIEMLTNIPFLRGVSPWILADFRSPRRPLPGIQDMYNRKGLISEKGERKQAFYILRQYYQSIGD